MSRLIAVWLLCLLMANPQIQPAPKNQSLLASNLTDEKLDGVLESQEEGDSISRLHLSLPNLSRRGWNRLAAFTALTRIDISRAVDLTDDQLSFTKRNSGLRVLTLARCNQITGSILANSDNWPLLSSVVIESKSFEGENLQHLKGKPIQALKMSSPLIRPRHLTAIGELRSLRELEIGDSPKLYAIDLSLFPNLQKLTIRNCGLRRVQGLDELKGLVHLSLLDCQHLRFLNFRKCNSLRTIEITNAATDNQTVRSLEALPGLTGLSLSGCHRITSIDLQRLSKLEELDLARTSLARTGVHSAGAATRLRRVDLSQCQRLSDDLIAAISALPQVKTIDVSGSEFSDAAYKMLEDTQERSRTRVYMEPR